MLGPGWEHFSYFLVPGFANLLARVRMGHMAPHLY